MIDTAAGSCGFPVHTIFYVWKQILAEKGIPQNRLFTTEKKPPECEDYVQKNVFAIDFDEKAVRVARTLNLIAGDGRTNVIHLNTLDYERWDDVTKDEAWQDIYFKGWSGLRKMRAKKDENRDFTFDILMANPPFAGDIKESRIIAKYELGKNAKGKYQGKVGRDILFIERNLSFLKPGGRMAIVLPQGRFNNSSDKYIRDFIAERCRILAVVGLHGNVFKPHTGTKTSVLFVQKWDDKFCPKKDDYPIFFATMQKPSKNNSGDKIVRLDDEGHIILDKHGHMFVDHDLFNHDGLTEDGIAEAFISSIEGSLQSCAFITDEFNGALCSTGFYILTSESLNPETLLVLFKSGPIQALMKQRCSGTILTAISKDELLSMPLPKIDDEVQGVIAEKVQESFSLRRQSKQLLESAKHAVEMAIEQGEDQAMRWLQEQNEI